VEKKDSIEQLIELLGPYREKEMKFNSNSFQGIKKDELERVLDYLLGDQIRLDGERPNTPVPSKSNYEYRKGMTRYTGVGISWDHGFPSFYEAVANYLENKILKKI
jgi:hypothetical protein